MGVRGRQGNQKGMQQAQWHVTMVQGEGKGRVNVASNSNLGEPVQLSVQEGGTWE